MAIRPGSKGLFTGLNAFVAQTESNGLRTALLPARTGYIATNYGSYMCGVLGVSNGWTTGTLIITPISPLEVDLEVANYRLGVYTIADTTTLTLNTGYYEPGAGFKALRGARAQLTGESVATTYTTFDVPCEFTLNAGNQYFNWLHFSFATAPHLFSTAATYCGLLPVRYATVTGDTSSMTLAETTKSTTLDIPQIAYLSAKASEVF
jgi:hypothetical protein